MYVYVLFYFQAAFSNDPPPHIDIFIVIDFDVKCQTYRVQLFQPPSMSACALFEVHMSCWILKLLLVKYS